MADLTEIKDADKVPFLDAPVSPPVCSDQRSRVFAEHFTEARVVPSHATSVVLAACFNLVLV